MLYVELDADGAARHLHYTPEYLAEVRDAWVDLIRRTEAAVTDRLTKQIASRKKITPPPGGGVVRIDQHCPALQQVAVARQRQIDHRAGEQMTRTDQRRAR